MWTKLRRCIRNVRGMAVSREERELLDGLEDVAKTTCRMKMVMIGFRSQMRSLVMEAEGQLFDFMLLWFLGRLFASAKERELCRASCVDVTENTLEGIAAFGLQSSESLVDRIAHLKASANLIFNSAYFSRPSSEFKDKLCRNPYLKFVTDYESRLIPRFQNFLDELAVLKQDVDYFAGMDQPPRHIKLPDPSASEIIELAATLHDSGGYFATLLKPKRILTHMENFRLALLHARLWLLRSSLHVCYGSSLSYGNLRLGNVSVMEAESIQERSQEPYPSLLEACQMESTVFRHSILKEGESVYHMKPDDFLASCQWKNVGYPVIVRSELQEEAEFQQAIRERVDDDELKEMVSSLNSKEPPRVLSQLRRFNPCAWEHCHPENCEPLVA